MERKERVRREKRWWKGVNQGKGRNVEKGGKEKGKGRERGKSEVKLGFREERKREKGKNGGKCVGEKVSLGETGIGEVWSAGKEMKEGKEKSERNWRKCRTSPKTRRGWAGKGLGKSERSEKREKGGGGEGTWEMVGSRRKERKDGEERWKR